MVRILGILSFFLIFLPGNLLALITEREKNILDLIAAERKLTYNETILLYAIRTHENGQPGLEFGIKQPTAQYYRDGFISLIVQADSCAWIIKTRFTGSLFRFAKSFHNGTTASNHHWYKYVLLYYKKYKKIYPIKQSNTGGGD